LTKIILSDKFDDKEGNMAEYKRHIIWRPETEKDKRILQVYKKGLEYAFYSKDNQQCTTFVFCKDFLQDVIQAVIHNSFVSLYKFTYRSNSDPLVGLDKTRLLLTNSKDRDLSQKIPACLDFIHQVEDQLKIKKTIVRPCFSPPIEYSRCGVWAFEGSKRWLSAPPMLSLYTLLLRVGFVHTPGAIFLNTLDALENKEIAPYQTRDQEQLKSSRIALDRILRTGDRSIFFRDIAMNYPKHVPVETMHHLMGIVAFANQMKKHKQGQSVLIPKWHY
jgi:hypothetical protein